MSTLFERILIANRGEIACRVAATCRRLGIASVAVYSDADADAQHVAACDEAVRIGGADPAQGYLDIGRMLAAARQTGARAIHPGYGFLSENEDFAFACAEAGLTFIGPPAEAIAAMGSKAAAKALMQAAAVPLVPGYHGDDQDPARLQEEADAIGYPVLLKASAGGGGKGMRVVEAREAFAAALASCRREAANSFGNDRVLTEKYLMRARHVEVQIFADRHGNAVWLFDRDCSVQRRHQKVLEEAPAPGLDDGLRRAMGEAAVAAARAVGYVGAGTVEFILAPDGAFYFMEMNTRLQVEHPVTEMVTGLDLVEWQLRVAAGEPLPLTQAQLRVGGHAIEARLYAENPARGFLPSTGRLRYLHLPDAVSFRVFGGGTGNEGGNEAGDAPAAVRLDSGVREGDTITPFYDPMIAKLIVHGADRDEALARLARALGEVEIVGPQTNVAFLRRLVSSAPFVRAEPDTGLIERHRETLFAARERPPREALALACASRLLALPRGDSPWEALFCWRLNGAFRQTLEWRESGDEATDAAPLTAVFGTNGVNGADGTGTTLTCDGDAEPFAWRRGAGRYDIEVTLGGQRIAGRVFVDGDVYHVFWRGEAYALEWQDPLAHTAGSAETEGRLNAPMPGRVLAVLVQPGARVEKGAPLMVMEAMKMEHTIEAPADGTVSELLYGPGDQVADGAQLLVFEPA